MKIKDLKLAEYNPRQITDKELDMLGKSMQEFGDLSGIIFNVKTKRLIGGHQRIKHLKSDWNIIKKPYKDKLGTVAEGYIETPYGRWLYREVDWVERKEMLANVAANKHGGSFDIPKLKDIMVELDDGSIDIELSGFDAAELEDIFGYEGKQGLTDDDAVPEVSEKLKTKTGDLYQLGNHRLLCGDATKGVDVEKLMDGKKADMVFSDPPYGIDLDTNYSNISGGWTGQISYAKSKKYKKIISDKDKYNPEHIFDFFDYCKEIFLWGANYYADKLPNLNQSAWMIWDKTGGGQQETVGSEFEVLWSLQKHRQIIISYKWAGVIGLSSQDIKSRIHPTQKPLQVLLPIIDKYSKINNLIIDLFLGSGSTLIACEKTERICYGMEIDPYYCDVIVKRWEDFTGKKANKVDI